MIAFCQVLILMIYFIFIVVNCIINLEEIFKISVSNMISLNC